MRLLQSAFARTAAVVFTSAAAAASLTILATAPPGSAHATHASAPAGAKAATSQTGYEAAGRIVTAAVSSKPFQPTKAQLAERNKLLSLPAAPIGPHPTAAKVAGPQGAPTTAPAQGVSAAPTDFTILKKNKIAAACSSSCSQSTVNEPDTASSGKEIIETSNWDIAYSTTGGIPWLYQNPYSLSSGFCCDQTVVYQPSRDRFIYEGLTLGSGSTEGFTIGVTASQQPTSWCVYHFDDSSFGGTAGDLLDYPKIGLSNNDLYVTWNHYNQSGAWVDTGLARMPLDSLDTCSGFNFGYLTRNDNFTFGLTGPTSSLDVYYWVSNWYTSGPGSGTSERIYQWAENSGTYFYNDIAVSSYNFSGGSCASQDGVVTNWCTRLDNRYETPWISRAESLSAAVGASNGDTILGVAVQAGPGGGDPFPYIIYEYFKLDGLTYLTTGATFNDGFAFTYAGCGVNEEGYVGCIESFGGGTGSTHYYPGTFLLLQDNVSPSQPWAFSFSAYGAGNASGWGDYMVAQPYQPETGSFIGTGWIVNSSNKVVPAVYVWGRGNATNGYNRWKGN